MSGRRRRAVSSGRRVALAVASLTLMSSTAWAADPIQLHAAGSLRAAMTEMGRLFEARDGTRVETRFGASGLLRDALVGGERGEVFASANMDHPIALAQAGRSGSVVLFARNRMCALARPGLGVDTSSVVRRMLDPQIKLGTSTPGADPSGDYAVEVFRRIEAALPGSFATLNAKALRLTGNREAPSPPSDRSIYAQLIEQGAADLFLTYCTNARAAVAELEGAQVVELPPKLAVGADYGLTVLKDASPAAYRFVLLVLSPEGQAVLAKSGFTTPFTPTP
ncbi:MAG TPA: molybdate ABC transporter substrate-binding protein [Beijerinckiaceae bacterium]